MNHTSHVAEVAEHGASNSKVMGAISTNQTDNVHYHSKVWGQYDFLMILDFNEVLLTKATFI